MFIKFLKVLTRILGVFTLALILSFTCLFVIELKKSDGNATKATMGVLEKVADNITECEPICVLILGVNDNLNQSLTDTIMLMGYHPNNQKAFLISIPRDTFIGDNINRAKASEKINSLYSQSPYKLVNAVEKVTNLNIDYYVAINNSALIKTVDIIGGVEFDVPMDMDYDDKSQNLHIHLKKGPQIIDGNKAEQLLRFRHNNNMTSYSIQYGDNDYGRMRTRKRIFSSNNKSMFK